MTEPRKIVARFRKAAPEAGLLPVHRPPHAAIARVWLLGDRYVLRARTLVEGTAAEAERQAALMASVRSRVPWRLPDPFPADDGRPFVTTTDALWTLYRQLPGRVLRPWQTLHQAPEADRRRLVEALRTFHRATVGSFAGGDPRWILRDVGARLAAAQDLLSDHAVTRVMRALSRVDRALGSVAAPALAFVHGDFHWGNLLVDDGGGITGLLDLDACRIGHPLEDLGYTAMMLLREPDLGRAVLEDLPRIAAWYDTDEAGMALLREYVVLYALYDVHLFLEADFPGRDKWLDLQVRVVETAARDLP